MAAILNMRVFPYIEYCILSMFFEHASKCRSSETTLRIYAAQLSLQVTILCAAIFVVSPSGDDGCASAHGRGVRAALIGGGGVVHLAGSIVENPHRLHLNTFKFSPKARRIVGTNVIGHPQMGR